MLPFGKELLVRLTKCDYLFSLLLSIGVSFGAVFTFEPRCEKTGLRGFRPGPTQTRLCNYRRQLEALNFGLRK